MVIKKTFMSSTSYTQLRQHYTTMWDYMHVGNMFPSGAAKNILLSCGTQVNFTAYSGLLSNFGFHFYVLGSRYQNSSQRKTIYH